MLDVLGQLLKPVLSLGGLSLLFGVGLGVAAKKFAVDQDPKIDLVRDALPGANCGACGYPGCDGLAAAIVAGEAPVDACPVGGRPTVDKVSSIMGVEAKAFSESVARVLCQGDCEKATEKYKYEGISDCKAAAMLQGGQKSCQFACLGLGNCERACPFDAIHVNEKGIAEVDKDKCTSCGICVEECPKDLIELIPKSSLVQVACKSEDKGRQVKSYCDIGCIGCRICVKACQFDAIDFDNNLASIDYEKCVNCMVCAEKCPTGSIYADFDMRKTAHINKELCVGCGICKRHCKFDAIEGAKKEKHWILDDKCTGCGECVESCPVKAISMK